MFSFLNQSARLFARRSRYIVFSVAVLGLSTVSFNAGHACMTCESAMDQAEDPVWQDAIEKFDEKIDEEFVRVEKFILHQMWAQSILPVMMLAAEQFSEIAIQQAMIVGMFIDAEIQLDSQRILWEIQAQAHKDYHPSIGMCEFGTMVKSLALTERKGEVAGIIMSKRAHDRQLGQMETTGMYGDDLDMDGRLRHYKSLFCNVRDRDSALWDICEEEVQWNNSAFDQDARRRVNKDIDYFSLIDAPWGLKLDLTNTEIIDTTSTPPVNDPDDEHVLAMAANLFAHNTFPRPPTRLLEHDDDRDLTPMQKAYMDMRSIIAKRSVAENSFYAISGLKAAGGSVEDVSGTETFFAPSVKPYMEHILTDLGIPDTETVNFINENPSYYAQMEILTKKIYQNPNFYTNLYDKPANVERKTVAMQAIKLMQKFDMLKSFLRGEATVSILLEITIADLQNEIEDQIRVVNIRNK